LNVIWFLCAIWSIDRLCRLVGISEVVGVICIGVICGPHVTNMIDSHVAHTLETFGNIGITLLMVESGTESNFEFLQQVWK